MMAVALSLSKDDWDLRFQIYDFLPRSSFMLRFSFCILHFSFYILGHLLLRENNRKVAKDAKEREVFTASACRLRSLIFSVLLFVFSIYVFVYGSLILSWAEVFA